MTNIFQNPIIQFAYLLNTQPVKMLNYPFWCFRFDNVAHILKSTSFQLLWICNLDQKNIKRSIINAFTCFISIGRYEWVTAHSILKINSFLTSWCSNTKQWSWFKFICGLINPFGDKPILLVANMMVSKSKGQNRNGLFENRFKIFRNW